MNHPSLSSKDAKNFQLIDWGLTHYSEAYKRQRECVQKRRDGEIPDTLIFTEHHPVFTVGRRLDAAKNLLCSKQELDAKGIDYVETNRGGDITYHGPEQIVGYSIISLLERQDLHRYLRDLEQVLINTLESLGLAAQHRKGLTGIWLKNRKVAAIGVSVKSWISYHGFALNVNNDLSPFSDIIPCGIAASQGSVSSLKIELKKEIDLSEIKKLIANEWQHIFC